VRRALRSLCAATLLFVLPVAGLAQRGAAPAGRGGGGRAPVQSRPAPAAGGFDFRGDIGSRPVPTVPIVRSPPITQRGSLAPSATVRQSQPQTGERAPQPVARERAPDDSQSGVRSGAHPGYRQPPFSAGAVGGPYEGRFHGRTLHDGRAVGLWGWNAGIAWRPVPLYWGGGFWGAFALASLADSPYYGSIDDEQAQIEYPSYEVEADSPGAELLSDYGLQQTPCGPPNLVVIWGPDDSLICAYPNASVAPGEYEVDPSKFTLIST
jgi:hypothetical protein